ncbi:MULTISPECIES: molybdate ABC transporter permease subunit [Spirosoma]|uniref:Molybdenum transport system permease n=1 Tax=Spirosoma liriopis TaxID=2937440 RepID=A0ABT0HDJ0_9BACT|nr:MULTISPECIES: molybdate ABC transporter permease subunit [Spirosoma]MCK8490236.1 molybdate ABC transporter permease subunit [Spirosoma liriopis]UHG89611.1 molybdate ABC transporter permease subunit [Spirosoma oryzicola]
MPIDWDPIWLTLRLASITTFILLLIGVPLAGWLALSRFRLKPLVETVISLPLVLPPSVVGFYLLLAFSPNSWLGAWLLRTLNLQLVFSFEGLVLASLLYSLPFMVHPIQAGLENLPISWREAAYTLGQSPVRTLWHVLLPNCKPALLTGIVLSFAHTIGEFGLVLMIGGNLPGQTRVASIAIYDEVELLHFESAHVYAALLLGLSFLILLLVYAINKRVTI